MDVVSPRISTAGSTRAWLASGSAWKEHESAVVREAGDDHFYGAWKGGSKASGGHPMTKASGYGDEGVTERDPYPPAHGLAATVGQHGRGREPGRDGATMRQRLGRCYELAGG